MPSELLAGIQQRAVEQHQGLEKDADREAEIFLMADKIDDVFYSGLDYSLVVAFAQPVDQPEKEPVPFGYILGSQHASEEDIWGIDDIYSMRQLKIDGRHFDTKQYDIGKKLMDNFTETLPENVSQLEALPLEGSERFYINNGFRGRNNSIFVKKLKT